MFSIAFLILHTVSKISFIDFCNLFYVNIYSFQIVMPTSHNSTSKAEIDYAFINGVFVESDLNNIHSPLKAAVCLSKHIKITKTWLTNWCTKKYSSGKSSVITHVSSSISTLTAFNYRTTLASSNVIETGNRFCILTRKICISLAWM